MDRLWAPWRVEYIQGPEEDHCIFCVDEDPANDQARLIMARGKHSYVIMNRYPYSSGHLMVAPYRHLADTAELENHEALEIHQMMVRSQRVLRDVCVAKGFNIGWNIGKAAGAGVADHIHMHIVPRWAGDSNFMPILAETRVIPEHIETTYSLLTKACVEI